MCFKGQAIISKLIFDLVWFFGLGAFGFMKLGTEL
jgi:hypothetical protein